MFFDEELNFQSHAKESILKARMGIGFIRYLSKYVSRHVLDQIFKRCVRPHLDYADILYHKYDPEIKLDITKRLQQTQYSAALAVTGTWRGTSRQRLYEDLGRESVYHRRWFRCMCHFFSFQNHLKLQRAAVYNSL